MILLLFGGKKLPETDAAQIATLQQQVDDLRQQLNAAQQASKPTQQPG
ncbi:hypothetical protein ACFOWZ_16105 [Lentzea rhizosphaerae]|uniref:Uncharacterized protein n=1 Tax=Lentzea rhizosphaerae TaxID=2041025 RepID=A0ABV8BV70_9PSEU